MVKISLIVPVYNAETTIGRCLSSLLSQTFSDYEILLIDDGSTDMSAAICQRTAEQEERVRYFRLKNGGPSAARNFGMDQANGAYFAFADSDDELDADALSFLYRRATEMAADLVLCGYYMENGGAVSVVKTKPAVLHGQDYRSHLKELKQKNLLDTSWNKLYRADFVRQSGIRYPEGELFEDTDFNLRLLQTGPTLVLCEECFYHYILHMGSITRRYHPEKIGWMKRRALLLKETFGDADDGYADFYYVKSVFSGLIDMFLSCEKAQIRAAAKTELTEETFVKAARTAKADGVRDRMIRLAARQNWRFGFAYCRLCYFVKYRMQRLFLRVRT